MKGLNTLGKASTEQYSSGGHGQEGHGHSEALHG